MFVPGGRPVTVAGMTKMNLAIRKTLIREGVDVALLDHARVTSYTAADGSTHVRSACAGLGYWNTRAGTMTPFTTVERDATCGLCQEVEWGSYQLGQAAVGLRVAAAILPCASQARRIRAALAKGAVAGSYRLNQAKLSQRNLDTLAHAERWAGIEESEGAELMRAEMARVRDDLLAAVGALLTRPVDVAERNRVFASLLNRAANSPGGVYADDIYVVAATEVFHQAPSAVLDTFGNLAAASSGHKCAVVLPLWAWHQLTGPWFVGDTDLASSWYLRAVSLPQDVRASALLASNATQGFVGVWEYLRPGLVAWSRGEALLDMVCSHPERFQQLPDEASAADPVEEVDDVEVARARAAAAQQLLGASLAL